MHCDHYLHYPLLQNPIYCRVQRQERLNSDWVYKQSDLDIHCSHNGIRVIFLQHAIFVRSGITHHLNFFIISHPLSLYMGRWLTNRLLVHIRGMFEMNCLLSSSWISTWGTIKTNTYLYRAIQYLHNGV